LPSGTSSPAPEAVPAPGRGLALVGLLTLAWGVHWPLVKVALAEVPPFTFRGIGALLGGLLLLWFARRVPGRAMPVPGEGLGLVWLALCNVALWQSLTAFALTSMPAGRGAVLAYTMPLWGVILGRLFLGEAIDRARLVALALGLAGMALLLADEAARLGAAPGGALLVLAAAFVWAVGTVATKRRRWRINLSALVAWQLILGSLPMLLLAVLLERDAWVLPSPGPAFAMGYNILIAALAAHWIWFRLLELYPAGIAAISTLAIPVVGVLASALLLGETIGGRELAALALVVAALAVIRRARA